MNPARFRWGILLILIGVLFLLNNIGTVNWWVWNDVWSLWPLLLIAIGVEKIFTRTKFEFIAYLAPLAMAGFVIWTAVESGNIGASGSHFGRHQEYSFPKDDRVGSIKADFNLNDDDLVLRGTDDYLMLASYQGTGRRPSVGCNIDNGSARVEVKAQSGWQWFSTRKNRTGDIEVDLYDQVPVSLKCSGDRARMRLDLSQLKVGDLIVTSDQGTVRVIVGKLLDKVRVALQGDEADVKLQFPAGSGVRLTGADDELARYLGRLGLTKSGNIYMSDGYDTLKPQIDIELKSGLSQLAVDYY